MIEELSNTPNKELRPHRYWLLPIFIIEKVMVGEVKDYWSESGYN